MDYNLAVTQKTTYLHFVVTGQSTRQNIERYIAEVYQECASRNCFNVLIEERLEGNLMTAWDVYQIVTDISAKMKVKLNNVAYVDSQEDQGLLHFIETIAINRALPVSVFRTIAEAEHWLQDKCQKNSE